MAKRLLSHQKMMPKLSHQNFDDYGCSRTKDDFWGGGITAKSAGILDFLFFPTAELGGSSFSVIVAPPSGLAQTGSD